MKGMPLVPSIIRLEAEAPLVRHRSSSTLAWANPPGSPIWKYGGRQATRGRISQASGLINLLRSKSSPRLTLSLRASRFAWVALTRIKSGRNQPTLVKNDGLEKHPFENLDGSDPSVSRLPLPSCRTIFGVWHCSSSEPPRPIHGSVVSRNPGLHGCNGHGLRSPQCPRA